MSENHESRPSGSSNQRVTVDNLRALVPLFQRGVSAEEILIDAEPDVSLRIPAIKMMGDGITSEIDWHLKVIALSSSVEAKEQSLRRLIWLAEPLLNHEITKMIAGSVVKDESGHLRSSLFFAGVEGMKRGLMKFDIEKINVSGTNYLFQWIVSYAKRELLRIEAPPGVSMSKYETFKKIAAVRKRMADTNGKAPTNEELLAFFHSGQADQRGKKGRLANAGKKSAANQRITLKLLQEQEEFESKMVISSYDPQSPPSPVVNSETVMMSPQERIFSTTVFGVFLQRHGEHFTDIGKSVLMSELGESYDGNFISDTLYKQCLSEWKKYLKDPNELFYSFLRSVDEGDFDEVDVSHLKAMIEHTSASRKTARTPRDYQTIVVPAS